MLCAIKEKGQNVEHSHWTAKSDSTKENLSRGQPYTWRLILHLCISYLSGRGKTPISIRSSVYTDHITIPLPCILYPRPETYFASRLFSCILCTQTFCLEWTSNQSCLFHQYVYDVRAFKFIMTPRRGDATFGTGGVNCVQWVNSKISLQFPHSPLFSTGIQQSLSETAKRQLSLNLIYH